MPTFIDESGDPGWADDSTPYFTLTAVWFQTPDLAFACDALIDGVRTALRTPSTFEFKFTRIGHAQKMAFLGAVAACPFKYVACTLLKRRGGRWLEGREWRNKAFFYERVVERVVRTLRIDLEAAQQEKKTPLNERVTFDEHHDPLYLGALRQQFQKLKAASGRSLVKKIGPGNSKSSNLLQLADMVCGSVVHAAAASDVYWKLIRDREGGRHVIP